MQKLYKGTVLRKVNSLINTLAICKFGQMDCIMQGIIFGLWKTLNVSYSDGIVFTDFVKC